MTSDAATVEDYIAQLPADRRNAVSRLRDVINQNIPTGFVEQMNYGMIGWVVPHSIFPDGYHCNPKDPLPFTNVASQKNFISFYHMGLCADESILKWFTDEFKKRSSAKLDMGKSCVRFKKPEHIQFELIGELVAKITVDDWIHRYTTTIRDARKRS
jgi:uncharacterized protein YdhG (YjbR/CyaY superfamily)